MIKQPQVVICIFQNLFRMGCSSAVEKVGDLVNLSQSFPGAIPIIQINLSVFDTVDG